jgi:hypothetical protein
MAITLADAAKFTQDKLVQSVIDEFRKDPILDMMVFDNAVAPIGSTLAYSYNRVTTLPTAATRAINADYDAQEAKVTQYTVNLKVLGGKFGIDRVIQKYQQGFLDQQAFQIEQKTQAVKALWADLFINGDSGVDANAFDGLNKAITGSSTEANTVAAIDLSTSANIDANFKTFMDELDKWLATLDGSPSMLLVNRNLMAIMNGIARRSNSFTTDINQFGQKVTNYSGIPFVTVGDKPGTANPIIPTTAGETSIYAARIGMDGVHGVSPLGNDLVDVYLPDFTDAASVQYGAVEMVSAMALKATRAAGAFRKIAI